MSVKYKLSALEIVENEYKLIVHSLIEKAKQQDCTLLAVSTSLQIKNEKEQNLLKIANLLQDTGMKIAVVNLDEFSNLDELCKGSSFHYVSFKAKATEADLLKLKSEYELVLVNLAPLKLFADAMILAVKCDGLVLMEKYNKTGHYQFDALLGDINENNIKLLGVIANA